MTKRSRRKPRKKVSRKPHRPRVADDDMSVTEVSIALGIGYQRARNAMLAGRFGECKYDRETRRLSVKRSGVEAFQQLRGGVAPSSEAEHSNTSKDFVGQRPSK